MIEKLNVKVGDMVIVTGQWRDSVEMVEAITPKGFIKVQGTLYYPDGYQRAEQLGVELSNYRKWENGISPNLETLCIIAKFYNVTTDYLLGLSAIPCDIKTIVNTIPKHTKKQQQDYICYLYDEIMKITKVIDQSFVNRIYINTNDYEEEDGIGISFETTGHKYIF